MLLLSILINAVIFLFIFFIYKVLNFQVGDGTLCVTEDV